MEVFISSDAYLRLWYVIDSLATEVGGMGYARMLPDADGDLLVEDVFVTPQVVSQSSVDFEETGGDEFAINKAIADGRLTDPQHVWVSWHSHNSMGVFWSQTDDDRISALHAAGIKHLLSFVGNHKHEYRLRYDAFDIDHFGCKIPHVTIDKLQLRLDTAEPLFEDCWAQVEEHVTIKKAVQVVWGNGSSRSSSRLSSAAAVGEISDDLSGTEYVCGPVDLDDAD